MRSVVLWAFCLSFFLSVTGLASDCKMHFASNDVQNIEAPCHDHEDSESQAQKTASTEKSCDHCFVHCSGTVLVLDIVSMNLESPLKSSYVTWSLSYQSVLPNPPDQPPRNS